MKLKNILLSTVALAALVSCDFDSKLDPLTGKFAKPTVATLTKVLDTSTEKSGNLRNFTLEIVTDGVSGSAGNYSGNGVALYATLVCNDYFLKSNTYTPSATPGNGKYLIGQTKVYADGVIKNVTDGSIIVNNNDGAYTLSAVVFAEDGTAFNLSWSGDIYYEPIIEYVGLTTFISAASNAGFGNPTISVKLATDGITTEMGAMGPAIVGTGNYLSVDIYSADGKTFDLGTYVAGAVGVNAEPGQFAAGYVMDLGFMKMELGTYWHTVENGVDTSIPVTDGTLKVEKNGDEYTLTIECDAVKAQYRGPINL